MPRDVGKSKAKIFGEKSGNFLTTIAECSECADGAAKLKDERGAAQGEKASAMTEESVEPAGDNETESGRESMLHPGASGKNGAAVSFSERGESVGESVEVSEGEIESGAELKYEGGVKDVLACGTPVDEASGVRIFLGDKRGELFDERNGEIAGSGGGAG